jgi:predicted membrane-bound mannosyltransferase
MDVILELIILAGVVLIGVGVVVLQEQAREAANEHHHELRQATELVHAIHQVTQQIQECIMANFEQFEQDMAGLKEAVVAAATRVEQKLSTLTDDSADQASVDQARADIQEEIAALKGIARSDEPAPELTEPAEPTA